MTKKKFFKLSAGLFVFIFVYEWLFHGALLAPLYHATAELWRPHSEMNDYFGWMVLGQLYFAMMFSYLFIQSYKGGGTHEGIRFGFAIALLLISVNFIMYSVTPYTPELILAWAFGRVLEGVLGGFLLARLYRD